MTPAFVVFLFIALTFNSNGSVSDHQLVAVADKGTCDSLVESYDITHRALNAQAPYAFKVSWEAHCERRILTSHPKAS